MKALVLSGGGARGAYQVGVLNALADIAADLKIKYPFMIYTGVSAGAINAAYMAAGCDDFLTATKRLTEMWSNLTPESVFKTDAVSIGKIGLQWLGELSFGGLTSHNSAGQSLLDTAPLFDLIKNNVDLSRIQKNIDSDCLHAVGITAIDYRTSKAITFLQGKENSLQWDRSLRKSEKTKIRPEHILASSAIPILFPSVQVDERYFGDGCVRNLTPCSPALRMGADELFVIGVRKKPTKADAESNPTPDRNPSIARIVNVLLNAILLDGIEADIERIQATNAFLDHIPKDNLAKANLKKINTVFVSPSQDIGELAASMSSNLPRVIRYLLKGLGPMDEARELISYLLFDPHFCVRLIEMGYSDGLAAREDIEKFFLDQKA